MCVPESSPQVTVIRFLLAPCLLIYAVLSLPRTSFPPALRTLKPTATGLERPPPPHSSNTWVQRGGRWRPSPYRYARETEALFWSTASQQKEDSPYAIFGLLQESDVKAEHEGSGHQRCPIEPICNRRYVTCMVKLQGSAKSGPQVG